MRHKYEVQEYDILCIGGVEGSYKLQIRFA
jgi:hypothetical protein